MLHKTKGIVFHTIKFTETSVIAKIYTEAFGLQSYIVNGVRISGPRNKAALFSPANILDLEIYHRENKNLQRLKEFRPSYIFRTLSSDILKSSIALFMTEILYKSIREEEANLALFDFIERSLIALDEAPKANVNFHLSFLLELSGHLGFHPHNHAHNHCEYFDLREGKFTNELPEHGYSIAQPHVALLEKLLAGESDIRMSLFDRNLLLEKMLLYYALHLHDFKKVSSHKVLHEVLDAVNT